jgi:hypothetical protein
VIPTWDAQHPQLFLSTSRQALYHLRWSGSAFVDQHGADFDALAYSRFKYGDGTIARAYANSLCTLFLQNYADWLGAEELPVFTGSAYKALPTAAQHILSAFVEELEDRCHLPNPIEQLHIHRMELSETDFSYLSLERRKLALAKNRFALPSGESVDGRRVVVIDDIRVTGAHEDNLRQLLLTEGASEVYFLYVAEADAISFATEPELEYRLNQCAVPNLEALLACVQSDDFRLNARVAGYLMRYPDSARLTQFFAQLHPLLLSELHTSMLAEGFQQIPAFAKNWQVLEEAVFTPALAV